MADLGAGASRRPRDSLSPTSLWHEFGSKDVMKYLAFADQHRAEDDVPVRDVAVEQLPQQHATESKSSEEQTNVITFSSPPTSIATPPAPNMVKQTCEPRSSLARSHRPFELELEGSRGATSLSTSDLRSLIKKTSSNEQITSIPRLQVIQHDTPLSPVTSKGRKKYSQQSLYGTTLTVRLPVARPPQTMGNQQSHHGDTHSSSHSVGTALYSSSEETGSSVDSVLNYSRVRPHKAGSKLAAMQMLKKKPPKTTSNKLSAITIEVPRAATAPNLDLIEDVVDEEEDYPAERPISRSKHVKTLSASSPTLLSHPGSPDTITEESAARPLSAGTTITNHSIKTTQIPSPEPDTSSPNLRVSALSPTIPTPSPVPQDSPHQYGLKDFTNTPSPQPAAIAKKAKRRSNGIEMFNVSKIESDQKNADNCQDARSLQTAASFLNGLSNARRRAESRAESRTKRHDTNKSNDISRLTSASATSLVYGAQPNTTSNPAFHSLTNLPLVDPPSPTLSSPPLTPKIDNVARTLGHTHKSSGYAYAKPLSLLQLKCYRNHERLLRSGNTHYPVECAVCHSDEAGDYFWSCSWCAVRMCGGCRNVFRQHGIKALREKIRSAEYGSTGGP